jgi:hypothetical protein
MRDYVIITCILALVLLGLMAANYCLRGNIFHFR